MVVVIVLPSSVKHMLSDSVIHELSVSLHAHSVLHVCIESQTFTKWIDIDLK